MLLKKGFQRRVVFKLSKRQHGRTRASDQKGAQGACLHEAPSAQRLERLPLSGSGVVLRR